MPKTQYNFLHALHWGNCKDKLCEAEIREEGKIEDAEDTLMIDFANKFAGGGVMNMGMV